MSTDYHPNPAINQTNVLGAALASCCFDPLTGYYRKRFCHAGNHYVGQHTVCAKMTSEFLNFSASRGNDLITPLPEYGFAGLQPGDYWCICALRWVEALDFDIAPQIKLEACHESLLSLVDIERLKRFAL